MPDPLSIFRGIRKLPAAHWLRLERGRLEIQPYLDLRFDRVRTVPDENACAEELRELLVDAVRARMVSDVPLGAFLSGGVDSATVVGIMSQISSEPGRPSPSDSTRRPTTSCAMPVWRPGLSAPITTRRS